MDPLEDWLELELPEDEVLEELLRLVELLELLELERLLLLLDEDERLPLELLEDERLELLLLDELEDPLDEVLEDEEVLVDTLAELFAIELFFVSTSWYPIKPPYIEIPSILPVSVSNLSYSRLAF